MLTYVKKDLFESPAQVLVNTVNTVGVMGKGIAKRFKDIYPDMFLQYQTYCERNLIDIGKLWIYKTPHKWILNLPTKKHWRSPSKLEYIEEALIKFVETYEEKGITSISFPLLGCGNGGLDWENQVKPLMEKYLKPLPIEVFIHLNEQSSKPEHKNAAETKAWLQSMPLELGFTEVWDDLKNKIKSESTLFFNNELWSMQIGEIKELEEYLEPKMKLVPAVFLSTTKDNIKISRSYLMDSWALLRRLGFLSKYDLPECDIKDASIVFALLNKLDYVEPVQISRNYIRDENFEMGVKLSPVKVANDSNIYHGEKPYERV